MLREQAVRVVMVGMLMLALSLHCVFGLLRVYKRFNQHRVCTFCPFRGCVCLQQAGSPSCRIKSQILIMLHGSRPSNMTVVPASYKVRIGHEYLLIDGR